MNNCYYIYGLKVSLPFICASLDSIEGSVLPDVVMLEDDIPTRLFGAQASGDFWQASPGKVLIQAPSTIGFFLAEEGNRVTFQRAARVMDELWKIQFVNMAMAIILQQRGLLVLHANSALTTRGAVVIAGESGSGKSTVLATLLAHGCQMLADDITAISMREDGRLVVIPGLPHLHLCAQSANMLGYDTSVLMENPWHRMKYAVPTCSQMALSAAPLQEIFILQRDSSYEAVSAQVIHGAEKFAQIQRFIYGPLLISQHVALFPVLTRLLQETTVISLSCPTERWAADEIGEVIMRGVYHGD